VFQARYAEVVLKIRNYAEELPLGNCWAAAEEKGSALIMSGIIRSEVIPGTVEHFRAVMQRLGVRCGGKPWRSKSDERLVFSEHRKTTRELVSVQSPTTERRGRYLAFLSEREHYKTIDVTPSTRGSWEILLLSQQDKFIGFAGIEAYEQVEGTTQVDFLDGYSPHLPGHKREPIGPAFEEFSQIVVLEAIGKQRKQSTLATDFDAIARLEPQPRGREFQKLFARMIAQHEGWSEEEGVRTSDEEIDVIVNRDREYYLVECKWERHGVEAKVIRDLYSKLTDRANTQGLVASLSGFTRGAVEHVQKKASDRIILLFGPWDVCALMYGRVSFDDLLGEKYDALVKRGSVLFS
jgi:HJR/Mrr/RecB family endonuclease